MTATMLAETEAQFRADPSAARSTPTVTATLANGRARLSAGAFNWDADLPATLGGENLAPSPTAYLLGALAGCAVAFLNDTLAPQFEVAIDDVTAVAALHDRPARAAGPRRRRARPRRPATGHPRDVVLAEGCASRRCSPPGASAARSTSRCSSRSRSS